MTAKLNPSADLAEQVLAQLASCSSNGLVLMFPLSVLLAPCWSSLFRPVWSAAASAVMSAGTSGCPATACKPWSGSLLLATAAAVVASSVACYPSLLYEFKLYAQHVYSAGLWQDWKYSQSIVVAMSVTVVAHKHTSIVKRGLCCKLAQHDMNLYPALRTRRRYVALSLALQMSVTT